MAEQGNPSKEAEVECGLSCQAGEQAGGWGCLQSVGDQVSQDIHKVPL